MSDSAPDPGKENHGTNITPMADTVHGRCGYVALIGPPNAGKSTLLNRLVGQKISIVTHKAQTTRARMLGIAIVGDAQLIFVDTPGLFDAKGTLDKAMVAAAWTGARDADVIVLMVDAARKSRGKGIPQDIERILSGLSRDNRKAVLALNKVDRVDKPKLLDLATRYHNTGLIEDVFMISAETGSGVPDLLRVLARRVPEGPWLYPEDQVTETPLRLLAAEITREKLFLSLHEELPYNLTVETTDWEHFDNGSIKITQTIFLARDAHKGMVLGKKGSRIKQIREAATADIAEICEAPVHLFLFVKVQDNWVDDPERVRGMGLDPEERM